MAIAKDKARADAYLDKDLTGRILNLATDVAATTEPLFYEGSVATNFYITGTFDGATAKLAYTPSKSLPLTPIEFYTFTDEDVTDGAAGVFNSAMAAGFYAITIEDATVNTLITAYLTGAAKE